MLRCDSLLQGSSRSLLVLALLMLPKAAAQGQYPPQITKQSSKDVLYEIGESLTLICEASGSPPADYYWRRNNEQFDLSVEGNRISIIPGGGSLRFSPSKQEDQASYQCFASNNLGTVSSVTMVARYAELLDFPQVQPRAVEVVNGQRLRVPCNMPRAFPLPSVQWGYAAAAEPLYYLDINSRVAVDHDGGLNFAFVEKSDEHMDPRTKARAVYYCAVFNRRLQKIVRGDAFQLFVIGTTPQNYPPKRMWVTPSQRTFIVGQQIRLMCIYGGRPEPELTWKRQDAELDMTRSKLESFGLELVIFPARRSDQGRYECLSERGDTAISRSIDVTIQAAPSWTRQLESITTARGETAEFRCEGEGIPPPKRAWFINGVPIEKAAANERRSVQDGVMTFTDIMADDSVVINCNISNSHGYVWGQAYLHVLEERPSIRQSPGVARVAVGQNARLQCQVFGAPPPEITWVKDGIERTGGRFVTDRTELTILNVQPPDDGEYHCVASNKYGSASAKGSVRVYKPTLLRIGPENLITRHGSAGRFMCVATTDAALIHKLRIRWMKDGHFLDFRWSQRLYQNPIDDSLVIANSVTLDSGLYTCHASNGLDAANGSATLVVEDVPRRSSIIDVNCDVTNKQVKVQWEAGSDSRAPLLGFAVQYRTSRDKDRWYKATNSSIAPSDNTLIFKLRPGSTYFFRVLSWNRVGWSYPSATSKQSCTIDPTQPPYNPKNVRGWGNTSNDMVIHWLAMQPVEHYGGGFKYEARYRKKGDLLWSETHKETDWTKNYWIVRGLGTFTEYEIQVECSNEHGPALQAVSTVQGFSGETTPQEVVQNFRALTFGGQQSSVHFYWDPPDTSQGVIGGLFRGFRIEMWPEDVPIELGLRTVDVEVYPELVARWGISRTLWQAWEQEALAETAVDAAAAADLPREEREQADVPLEPGQASQRKRRAGLRVKRQDTDRMITDYVVRHVPADTVMIARIRIFNIGYLGAPSESIKFTTPEAAPGSVDHLHVVLRSPNTIRLTWQPPLEPNGRITGYHVTYRTVDGFELGNEHPFMVGQLGPQVQSVTLTGLTSMQNYRVFVFAKTAAGMGPAYFLDVCTLNAAPPSAPTFRVINVQRTAFEVEWSVSTELNPGSIFYVEYRIKGTSAWSRSPEIGEGSRANVTGLAAGSTYEVRVVAALNLPGSTTAAELQELQLAGRARVQALLGSEAWFVMLLLLLLVLVVLLALLVWCRRYRKSRVLVSEKDSEVRVPMRSAGDEDVSEKKDVPHERKQEYLNPYAEGVGQVADNTCSESRTNEPSAASLSRSAAEERSRSRGRNVSQQGSTGLGSRSLQPAQTSTSSIRGPRYAVVAPPAFNPYAPPPNYQGSTDGLNVQPPRGPKYATKEAGGSLHSLSGEQQYPSYRAGASIPQNLFPTYTPRTSPADEAPVYTAPRRPATGSSTGNTASLSGQQDAGNL